MSQRFNMRVGAEAVIVRDDAILLVEYGNGWKRHFNLPGGGIEPGESIVDGLRREIREETCAEITVGPLLLALVVLATEPLIPEIAGQLLALIATPPTHNPFGEA